MRILDMQLPPGDMSWFHTHDWPVLLLALGSSQTRTQILGLEWGARPAGAGAAAAAREGAPGRGGAGAAPAGASVPAAAAAAPSVRPTSTTSYADAPVTHRLENIGNGVARNIVVVNETLGDDTTSEQAAGFTGKPELNNKWFRAYRVVLSPGERTATHKHRAPVAIIQVTAGKGLGSGAMAWDFNEAGQWAFFDAGDSHDFRNTGEVPLQLIEVEIRRK
jgi:quercetin dioxygenase-like cupin family protein